MFAEPVQNSRGCLVPPDGYWAELRAICDRYGILLVADEVICAYGRLGEWFGSTRYDVVPDLITFAKGATSGYAPLGGMLVRRPLVERLMDSPQGGVFTHGATWGGHPVATAVASANLAALRDEDALGNVRRLEPTFQAGLDRLAAAHHCVREWRGTGFFYAVELMADRRSGRELTPEQSTELVRQVMPQAMRAAGLITRPDDRGATMLMLSPPLVADEAVLDELFGCVDQVLDAVERARRRGDGLMRVGVPREVKVHEYRVALTPAGAHELVAHGHDVLVERGAGVGSSISDDDYLAVGAKVVDAADDVWADSELVLKVKEPIESEYHRLREGLVLFTYLHLAASRPCTDALLGAGTTAIAYETVQLPSGALPLLHPMSEVAGCLAPQAGAHAMLRAEGGRGLLLGGVSGVAPAKVVVLGGGVAGRNATAIAAGMWAEVTVLDTNVETLRTLDRHYRGRIRTVAANAYEVEKAVLDADLVIGAVLVAGERAPRLVSNDQVAAMRPGSVLVDVAIDQGGCFEDSRPTTHADPTYRVHESVFYCVANMPGAVPHTSTYALTNTTLPYAVALADKGWRHALARRPGAGRRAEHVRRVGDERAGRPRTRIATSAA